MIVRDLIKNKDYDYISYRAIMPEHLGGGDMFAGVAKSKNGKLIPLDGDCYSENAEVVSYEEWENEEEGIKNGLTIFYNWESGF